MVAQYQFYASTDRTNWGTAVASRDVQQRSQREARDVHEQDRPLRPLRRRCSEINGQPWASVAELDLIGVAQ